MKYCQSCRHCEREIYCSHPKLSEYDDVHGGLISTCREVIPTCRHNLWEPRPSKFGFFEYFWTDFWWGFFSGACVTGVFLVVTALP